MKSICVCFFILAKGRSINLHHNSKSYGIVNINIHKQRAERFLYRSLDYFVNGDVNDFGFILIVIINVPTRLVGCFNLLSCIDDDYPRKV